MDLPGVQLFDELSLSKTNVSSSSCFAALSSRPKWLLLKS
jgi:hypothetical protein